jgi:hypothetical protein
MERRRRGRLDEDGAEAGAWVRLGSGDFDLADRFGGGFGGRDCAGEGRFEAAERSKIEQAVDLGPQTRQRMA